MGGRIPLTFNSLLLKIKSEKLDKIFLEKLDKRFGERLDFA